MEDFGFSGLGMDPVALLRERFLSSLELSFQKMFHVLYFCLRQVVGKEKKTPKFLMTSEMGLWTVSPVMG